METSHKQQYNSDIRNAFRCSVVLQVDQISRVIDVRLIADYGHGEEHWLMRLHCRLYTPGLLIAKCCSLPSAILSLAAYKLEATVRTSGHTPAH